MIYCVEDDSGIRDLMIYTLKKQGFEAEGFTDSVPFWKAVEKELPELIILDIMLPGEDGISILRRLRESHDTELIPVIMATAKGNEYDKVLGLDLGADDYLSKPFGMMEMVSRIKAVLRRTSRKNARELLEYKDITIDTAKHNVSVNGDEVSLTLKEYDILHLFMENIGIAFSRDQLLEKVWDIGYSGETRTVDVHIGTLRTKLGNAGDLIHTVRGIGYKLE